MVGTQSPKRNCFFHTWKNQFLSSFPKTCWTGVTVSIHPCTITIILVMLCMATLTQTMSVQHCTATIILSIQVHSRQVNFVCHVKKSYSICTILRPITFELLAAILLGRMSVRRSLRQLSRNAFVLPSRDGSQMTYLVCTNMLFNLFHIGIYSVEKFPHTPFWQCIAWVSLFRDSVEKCKRWLFFWKSKRWKTRLHRRYIITLCYMINHGFIIDYIDLIICYHISSRLPFGL